MRAAFCYVYEQITMFSFLKSLFSKKEKDNPVYLLVGLGNPGDKYCNNRHNIGFMAVDRMADGEVNFPPFRDKFEAQISEERVGRDKAMLMKPMTYMNESGRSVGRAAKFYKIAPENIIVFHDELDLKPGEVRIKKGGGNAGHNGLKSITQHLGAPDFWRVRIGIGHPGNKNQVSNYVLSDFAKSDQIWLEKLLERFEKKYSLIVDGDMKSYEEHLKKD